MTANGGAGEPAITRDALVAREHDRLLGALSRHLARGQPYALLDFPDHSNVGDSAIWLGEVRLLAEISGRPPSFAAASDADLDALRRELPDGPIFLHGGGNFGDIYPRHQQFRERVLRAFPDRPVIQLPQSIKYRDPAGIDATAEAIAAHRAFTLAVRDHASLALALKHFDCEVVLLPDAAFGLGALARSGPPRHERLLLLRQDVERVARDLSDLGGTVADWLGDPPGFDEAALRAARTQAALSLTWSRPRRRALHLTARAEARVARGLALLSSGRTVVTDRLHGHILSTLLGIPHVALDNDYGKIHGYIAAWTAAHTGVRKAATAAEAAAALAELAEGHALAA